MKLLRIPPLVLMFLTIFIPQNASGAPQPKISVVFVIDQFAYCHTRLVPYFNYGLKELFENGIVYSNAHHPHGMTATATGHAALSTGTYAKDHGFIGNRWFDAQGNKVICDDDTPEHAAVFKTPTTFYDFGKSSKQLMVDTISDQFVLNAPPEHRNHAYAVSIKSRSSNACAGKAGKAIWFDQNTGNFTSSKAYFDRLPKWLVDFNKTNPFTKPQTYVWKTFYPIDSPAYAFANANVYDHVSGNEPLIGKPINVGTVVINPAEPDEHGMPFDSMTLTPAANEMTLKNAQAYIEHMRHKDPNAHLLIWICLTSPDRLGHHFGPNSLEVIDMYYHLDKQIGDFMQYVYGICDNKHDALFATTGDHGVSPIIESLKKDGYWAAQRIFPLDMIAPMNALIKEKFGIDNVVQNYKTPQFFIDKEKIKSLDKKTRKKLMYTLKTYLAAQPGIKKVWLSKKLRKMTFASYAIENFFKQQLYPGRSGQITIQTFPYSLDTKWPHGTDHRSGYNYDTHVPIVIYQPNVLEKQKNSGRVWTLQFAPSLARILDVPRPSASVFNPLPSVNRLLKNQEADPTPMSSKKASLRGSRPKKS